jgi:hypothetical protein
MRGMRKTLFVPIAAFVAVVFGLILLIGLSVVRADPSANVTIHVTPVGGGDPCSTTPPGPVTAAGYTQLIFCADFTSAAYANINTWLDCKGASSPTFNYTTFGNFSSSCNRLTMATDPSDGSQVFRADYTPADVQACRDTHGGQDTFCGMGLSTCWNQIEVSPGNNGALCPMGFHTSFYMEITTRATNASFTNNLDGQALEYWWVGAGGGTGTSSIGNFNPSAGSGFVVELDGIEIHPQQPDGFALPTNPGGPRGCLGWLDGVARAWCGGPDPYPYDPSQYHTYGFLSMIDGSNFDHPVRVCGSVDGVWTSCGTFQRDSDVLTVPVKAGYLNYAMGGIIFYTNGWPNGTTAYVKNMRVFSCPTWNATQNTCQQTGGYPSISTVYGGG